MPFSMLDRQKPPMWMGPNGKPINKQVQVGPGQVTGPTQQLAQAMNPQPMKAPVNPQYGDLAKAMIGQGTSTAPVSGNLEAIARPLEALAGVYLQRKQGEFDTKSADYKHQQLAQALGGITDPTTRARVQQAMEINPALGATMYGQATAPAPKPDLVDVRDPNGNVTRQPDAPGLQTNAAPASAQPTQSRTLPAGTFQGDPNAYKVDETLNRQTGAYDTDKTTEIAPEKQSAPPEIIQLAIAAGDQSQPENVRKAAEGRITALTKGQLSPFEIQEIGKSADGWQAGEFAAAALTDALALNDKAYSGAGADVQRFGARALGLDEGGVTATTQFGALMTGQALESLRATFGGNPTEGERQILLEIQAAPTMNRAERAALIQRAVTMVRQKQAAATSRVNAIQTGQFRMGGEGIAAAPPGTVPVQPTAGQPQVLRFDAQGNPVQ